MLMEARLRDLCLCFLVLDEGREEIGPENALRGSNINEQNCRRRYYKEQPTGFSCCKTPAKLTRLAFYPTIQVTLNRSIYYAAFRICLVISLNSELLDSPQLPDEVLFNL